MGYNILSTIIEFTDSKDTLEKSLYGIAALLVKFFTFDQYAVYLLDQEKKILNLAVELEFRFN